MSHFTAIQTQIRDLEALREACDELGLLQLRQPDWTGDEGCTGWAEFRWSRKPDGSTATKIGGVIDYRYVETSSEEFWSSEEAA